MVLVVVEHVLAVAVIEVQHDELGVALADAVTDIEGRVEVEVPALALDKGDVGHPAPVGGQVRWTHARA